jgi:hypothetical protein
VIWVLVIVVAVLLCAVIWLALRQRRTAQLREGFGPEYDRTLEERGDQRAAEAELRERVERRRSYEVRELEPEARDRFAARWRETQARFVDQPASTLADADSLVNEVMRERGYPVDDFETQAADVSVDHPGVVEHYRQAHAVRASDETSTEELREAFVHYRALFAELLGDDEKEANRSERVEEVR